jgi:hypothetical protein
LAPPFQITYLNYGPEGFYIADYCIGTDEECGVVSSSRDRLREVEWSVFPNPVTEWLYVEWEKPFPKHAKLIFFDHLGRQLFSANLPHLQNKLELNVKALSKGMYFYQITDKKKVLGVGKLIIE